MVLTEDSEVFPEIISGQVSKILSCLARYQPEIDPPYKVLSMSSSYLASYGITMLSTGQGLTLWSSRPSLDQYIDRAWQGSNLVILLSCPVNMLTFRVTDAKFH
jgi:hypothetical protein